MSFVYTNEKMPQLGYYDGAVPILLQCWIRDASDLRRADELIRARYFGSLPFTAFFVRTWTYYSDYAVDSDVIVTYRDMSLFAPSGYINTTAPIGRIGLGLS